MLNVAKNLFDYKDIKVIFFRLYSCCRHVL